MQNFTVNFDADNPVVFNGAIYVATGGAKFLPGRPISATVTDRKTADDRNPDGSDNDEAMRATLQFSNGRVSAFKFSVDTLNIQLGSFVTITSTGFMLDTGATGTQEMVSFISVGAQVKIGSLVIGGKARNFAFLGNGSFQAKTGFGIFLSIGSATGDSFKWPSWLPIKINALGIQWDDVENHPEDFVLTLSASVTGLKAVPGLKFSGSIEGVKIKPSLLLEGKFPIIDIASIGVSVEGKLFGGELNAALIGGILKLDANGNMIGDLDTTTPVKDRIFFLGVQGGFSLAGIGGLTIRFALSELGPLSVLISAEVPGGILLEPTTGLTINDFVAGVEFFKTLPSIDDPFALRNSVFDVQATVPVDQWLGTIKQQVVLQFKAIQADPSKNGFTAAFTSPMTITGSAKIYSIYTSQQLFNGQVVIKISTDGKFLISGKLNFAADNISLSGKLYADLSKVASGDVTVLFLADIPDQVRLLTIYGRLKMGFRNASGQEVEFQVVDDTTPSPTTQMPTIELVDPAAGSSVNLATINAPGRLFQGKPYVDVVYHAPPGASLDLDSILDSNAEFQLTIDGVARTVGGTPIPIVTTTTADGLSQTAALVPNSGETLAEAIRRTGTNRFRYLITEGNFQFTRGSVQLTFPAGSLKNADVTPETGAPITGAGNVMTTLGFAVDGATALLADPASGGRIDINVLNNRNYIDIIYAVPTTPAGLALDLGSITDTDPEFTLSGVGLGTIALDAGKPPVQVAQAGNMVTFRYWLTGQFASTGNVSLTYIPGSWGFTQATVPAGPLVMIALDYHLDVTFPDPPAGFQLDPASINGDEIAFDTVGNGWTIGVSGTPTPQNGTTYRYQLNVTLPPNNTAQQVPVTYHLVAGTWNVLQAGPLPANNALTATVSPSRAYIDVTFPDPAAGLTLDPASITDADLEIQIDGAGNGWTVALAATAPVRQGMTNTYRFAVNLGMPSGNTATETNVSYHLVAGTWNAIQAGAVPSNNALSGSVSLPAAPVAIEVEIPAGPDGYTLDPASVLDTGTAGREFTLSVTSGNWTVLLNDDQAPVRVGETNRFRFFVTITLPGTNPSANATVSVTFLPGTWSYSGAAPSTAPVDLGNLSGTNSRTYFDVTFLPVAGGTIDEASITDLSDEFALSGAGTSGVSLIPAHRRRSARTRSATTSWASSARGPSRWTSWPTAGRT